MLKINAQYYEYNSHDNSVGMVTSYGMEGTAFESRQGQDISLLQNVQTGSELYSPWVRRTDSGVGHRPPSSAEAINVWDHTSIPPICFHGVGNGQLKVFKCYECT
jgi:hypothetical protein